MSLVKTKTFWVGVVSILAAIVAAVFGGNETIDSVNVVEAGKALLSDEKLYVGLGFITGRAALLREIRSLVQGG